MLRVKYAPYRSKRATTPRCTASADHFFQIVHVLCERILKLCGCWIDEFQLSNLPFTTQFLTTKTHGNIKRHESTYSISSGKVLLIFVIELSDMRFSVGNPDMESAKSAPVSPNTETVDKDAFSGNPP